MEGPLGNARSGRLSLSPRAVSARSSGVSGASRKSRLGRVWGVSAASGGVWPASGPASRVWAASLARLSRPAGLASVPGSSFVVVGSVLGWSLASFFSRPGRVPRLRRVSAASRGVLAASCRVPELASPASRPRLQDATLPRGPYEVSYVGSRARLRAQIRAVCQRAEVSSPIVTLASVTLAVDCAQKSYA